MVTSFMYARLSHIARLSHMSITLRLSTYVYITSMNSWLHQEQLLITRIVAYEKDYIRQLPVLV